MLRSTALKLFVVLGGLGGVACTHTMEVKNLHDYSLTAQAPRSLSFEVDAVPAEPGSLELGRAAKERLATHSSVARVAVPGEAPPDFHPDYVVTVKPTATYDGSGWNYLITFPGFLIFTHAWNGFVYHSYMKTDLEVRRPGSTDLLASRQVDTNWDFRHCDFGRGAWTSSGWYTPFYGGLNLIIGFWMIKYDDDATIPLVTALHDPYGDYIANNVIDLASEIEKRDVTPAAAPPLDAPSAAPPAESPPPPAEPTPVTN